MERVGVAPDGPGTVVAVGGGPEGAGAVPRGGEGHPRELGVGLVPRWARSVGWALLGAQLLGMLVFSTVQYKRFTLTGDFANYSQAWWAIAHGHLDPFSTGLGVPFWKNNGEFALWPLSLLFYLHPHPVVLLWVQDIVVVVTELIVFRWILAVIEGARGRIPRHAPEGMARPSGLPPSSWPTRASTRRSPSTSTWRPSPRCSLCWSPYDLWSRPDPTAVVVGAPGADLVRCGWDIPPGRRHVGCPCRWTDPTSRCRDRRGVGLVWVVALNAIGGVGVGGRTFTSSYGYLVGPHNLRIGVVDVVLGAFGHPSSGHPRGRLPLAYRLRPSSSSPD